MRRVTMLAAVMLTGSLALTACGNSNSTDKSSPAPGGKTKVGLAYDIGGRGDQSFNDAAYAGFSKAVDEFGLSGSDDLEPKEGEADADKVQRLTELARQGFNPVIGIGFAYSTAMEKVVKKFPNTDFAIVDDSRFKADNLANLVFSEEQGSYLVGMAAALKTKADNIGFIGGVNTPLIQKFQAGFQQGAKAANKDVKVQVQYITQPPDFKGFSDPASGKKVAQGMLDNGADVIFAAAGASGGGAMEAIAGDKKWAIGVDSDQYKQQSLSKVKGAILTSMTKNVEGAVYNFIKSVVDKKPQSGVVTHDLSDNGVGYATSNPEFAQDKAIIDKLEAAKKKIVEGDIKVDSTVSG